MVSPGGIEAWLVREQTVPLVALNFAFHGGSTQDPADKAGVANLAADLLDEGAGDLDGKTFHERLENHAIELGFRVGRDYFRGSLRTLNEHRDEAFDLLAAGAHRAALRRRGGRAGARADAVVVAARHHQSQQPRQQPLVGDRVPGPSLWPPVNGTLDTVPTITADDLRGLYPARVRAQRSRSPSSAISTPRPPAR